MKNAKIIIELFLSFLKIGLFTFGGGLSMLSIIENDLVSRKEWMTHDEFLDMVTIAESTPGPIAINAATYIGYKRGGFIGATAATVAICIPSIAIIYLISLFFDRFMEIEIISNAFLGIQVGVIFLIFSAGVKMLKKMKKTALSLTLFALTFIMSILFTLLSIGFSTVYFILLSGFIGIVYFYISAYLKSRGGEK